MNILITGATGYVGGCLLRELQQRGHSLRCLARRLAAEYFAEAARAAGVKRIIYLGGLGDKDDALSAHLRSRHEVGAILRASGLDVIEFRASIIIGAGSFSFDLVRTLVERLPVMICPAWLATPTQPIAITDVIAYLADAIDLPAGTPRIFEIGGPDRVSYGAIMKEYARQRCLRRLLIPVPVLTPRLSSLWLHLVTPQYAKVGRKLIEGLKNPTVVTNDAALREFAVRPRDVPTAIHEADGSGRHDNGWQTLGRSCGPRRTAVEVCDRPHRPPDACRHRTSGRQRPPLIWQRHKGSFRAHHEAAECTHSLRQAVPFESLYE